MATFSLASTQPRGTFITSTMYAAMSSWRRPPTVRAVRLATQTISASVWTAIAWSSKDWDSNTMFATTGTKLTCKTAGKFQVNFMAGFKASTTGTVRGLGLRKNTTGTGVPGEGDILLPPPKTGSIFNLQTSISNIISLTTGQFVEGCIFSDGSGNGLVSSTGTDKPRISMLWVST